jgi:hypothetical protein
LRTQKENIAVWHAWRDKVGAEMTEEEKDPEGEFRYDYNYENSNEDGRHGLFDWCEEFDEEIDSRRKLGSGPAETVYVLP